MSLEDLARKTSEESMSNHVAQLLGRTYPGHRWGVQADTWGGILKIILVGVMDETTAYVIRLNEISYSEKETVKAVIKAGGELLERFGLSREAKSQGKVQSELSNLKRDFRGLAKMDKRNTANYVK